MEWCTFRQRPNKHYPHTCQRQLSGHTCASGHPNRHCLPVRLGVFESRTVKVVGSSGCSDPLYGPSNCLVRRNDEPTTEREADMLVPRFFSIFSLVDQPTDHIGGNCDMRNHEFEFLASSIWPCNSRVDCRSYGVLDGDRQSTHSRGVRQK